MSKLKNFKSVDNAKIVSVNEIDQLTPTEKFDNLISAIKKGSILEALTYITFMSTEDLNQSDSEGRNCLHWAVLKNNQAIVRALCTNQTSSGQLKISDFATNLIDNHGYSALNYASINGYVDLTCIIFNNPLYTENELKRKMKLNGSYNKEAFKRCIINKDLSILVKKSDTLEVKNFDNQSNYINIYDGHNHKKDSLVSTLSGETEQSYLDEIIA